MPEPRANGELLIINRRCPTGYSLIELLVVIAIFGITITLVTASYIAFERNQRFRSASNQLKNDIRFAQNKAFTGDKSSPKCSISGYTLAGWYVRLTANNSGNYSISSVCKDNGVPPSEDPDLQPYKTFQLPKGVEICNVNGSDSGDVYIFFQPLLASPTFHLASVVPPFFDSNGNLQANIDNQLEIYLRNAGTNCGDFGTYKVVILLTGEVNEVKL